MQKNRMAFIPLIFNCFWPPLKNLSKLLLKAEKITAGETKDKKLKALYLIVPFSSAIDSFVRTSAIIAFPLAWDKL
jgi:hypothetical protein